MEEKQKQKKLNPAIRERGYLINILILCGITMLALLTAVVVLLWPFYYTKNDVDRAHEAGRQEVLKALETGLTEEGSAIQAVRSLYPDMMVVDEDGSFSFYEMDRSLINNELLAEDFSRNDNDCLVYSGPGGFRSESGIVLTEGSGVPDWEEVKAQGITFAFISLGRFNSQSELIPNTEFGALMASAKEADIRPCVQVTVTAWDEESGRVQARDILRAIREDDPGFAGTVAIYLRAYAGDDEEEVREGRTEGVKKILDTLKDFGCDPVVGGDLRALCGSVRLRSLKKYGTWVADYTDDPYYPYAFRFWTYGSSVQLKNSGYRAFLIMELIPD